MRRLASTLVVIAIVAGACSDSSTETTSEYIEPVPFDETTTLPTTTTVAPATTAFDAATAFDTLIDASGLGEIPPGAWIDFANAGCFEGIWDRGVNFAFAEDFSQIDATEFAVLGDDQLLIAELLWLKAAELCGEDFPAGALDRGPPAIYEYPRCRQPLGINALPWSDEVPEADSGQDHGVGISFQAWSEGDQTLAVIQGADDSFDREYTNATVAGTINGNEARVTSFDDGFSVGIIWRQGPGHCDAFRMYFQPPPETDDLIALAESLLRSPPIVANAAEIRMAAAVPLVRGYTPVGGEPSHGGPDAVYAFEDDAGWYDVHVIPADIEDPDPPNVAYVIEVDGTAYEVFDDNLGDGVVPAARFEADGYRITVRTSTNEDRLLIFADEFLGAWLGAAPSSG